MTNGEITIKKAVTQHMGMILQVYKKLGINVQVDTINDEIFVPKDQDLHIAKTIK